MTRRVQLALVFAMIAVLMAIYTVWDQLGVFNVMYQLLGWNMLAVPIGICILGYLLVWKD